MAEVSRFAGDIEFHPAAQGVALRRPVVRDGPERSFFMDTLNTAAL
jgi:hypothetical protein